MNKLKIFLFCGFLLGTFYHLFSQEILFGTVYDEKNNPIPGVTICQGRNFKNGSISGNNGEFSIELNEKDEKTINFSFIGYTPVNISVLDSINQPLTIILKEESVYLGYPPGNRNYRLGYISSYGIEAVFADFTEFEDILESYNTEFMSGFVGTMYLDFTGTYRRFNAGIGLGFSDGEDTENDSLNVRFNITQYNLGFGYNVINYNRIIITPTIGVKWNRYKLINSIIEKKIPIEYYISDKDLDIRFNQTYAYSGLKIAINPELYSLQSSYLTFGVFGGYILPLNKVPWTYSSENRLLTDKKINIENYYYGIFVSLNIP